MFSGFVFMCFVGNRRDSELFVRMRTASALIKIYEECWWIDVFMLYSEMCSQYINWF